MAETYSKAWTWMGNDDINIPQFPNYAEGTNSGAGGTTLIDASANFNGSLVRGTNSVDGKVEIGDVIVPMVASPTCPDKCPQGTAVQVTEVTDNNTLELSGNFPTGVVYYIHRSNGGINNSLVGNEGYLFIERNPFDRMAYIPAGQEQVIYRETSQGDRSQEALVKAQRVLDFPVGDFVEVTIFDN